MRHPNPEIAASLAQLASPDLPLVDLSLNRIRDFLKSVGNPQDHLPPVVHVAGTNGKGSLLAYLKAIYEAAGYRVHRLTSPYLVTFNEQITLNGTDIDDRYLGELLRRITARMQHYPLTLFEATTALAFIAFMEVPADIVLLETGLGGRLDSTNVIARPALTAIMPVSMDHAEFLGSDVATIAREKAGILKPNVPCVVGMQSGDALATIMSQAKTVGSPTYIYGQDWQVSETASGFTIEFSGHIAQEFPVPSLAGEHQLFNAATAIACIRMLPQLPVNHTACVEGITRAVWPARLQHIAHGKLAKMLPGNIELWLDGGHNAAGAMVLAKWMQAQHKPVHIIAGILRNKDAHAMLAAIAPLAASFTAIPVPDDSKISYDPVQLAAMAAQYGAKSATASDAETAITKLIVTIAYDSIILICGSLYLAGKILYYNNYND